jgi:C4-dicarboxylate-specific signal transduction histidine kinase
MIKFKTLRRRIFTLLTSAIVIVAGSISYYLLYDLESRYYRTFNSVTTTINNALVENIRGYVYNNDYEHMNHALDSIKSPYIRNMLILDPKGRVIASQQQQVLLNQYFKDFKKLLDSETKSVKNNQQHTILNTFELLDIPLGYLVVEGNMEHYLSQLNSELRGLLTMIVSFFILTISIAFYLSTYISRPLYRIINTLQTTQSTEMLHFEEASEKEFRYLSQNIAAKHNALLELNLQLEEKVEEKIIELKKLNEALEHKVQEAVEETQRKEQLLHKQSRLAQMGEMVSMIAHQWRQPLAAITSTMLLIERHLETDKFSLKKNLKNNDFIEFINSKHELIYNNIEYLSTTTDDFRDFFNPNSTKEHLNVNKPIEKALMLIEKSIINKGIHLHVDLQSKQNYTFYPNELMQVILNLLKNASDALVEHNSVKKSLWVESYDNESEITIKIKDNGIGISPETEEHIFDPYFSTKVQKIGTGLGLYMSKNIIEEHNAGYLEYTKENGITCFVIRFSMKDKV